MMTMVIMAFVVIGLFSFSRLAIDLFPPIEFPYVSVMIVYPGAGPEETETLISEPVEEAVSSINGVKNVWSISQEGLSTVMVEFQMGKDVDFAALDVKDKVDAIRADLPEEAKTPTIFKFDIQALPIMDLAVFGPRALSEVYQLAKETIKDELAKIDGLASISVIGGREREILIAVDRERLKAYDLSILDIVQALALRNLNIPSGRITEDRYEYAVRLAGKFESVDDIRNIRMATEDGQVNLTDLAQVIDTFAEQRELARFNGQSSVGLSLQKRADANTVKVAREVKRTIAALKNRLPSDVKIDIARDRSDFIRHSVNDVLTNMLIGILLTAVVLYLFLHSWKEMLIAAVAMPTSIIATFSLIYFAGFTLNMMSLMGLAISVGILVANAIVVLENIHRFRGREKDPKVAADRGTTEIALAVMAATLTNVVVFLPIAFMSGIVGQFFKQFGITVTFATLFSLVVSFTLTPMLASKLLKRAEAEERRSLRKRFFDGWDRYYDRLAQGYKGGLNWALGHRAIIVLLCLAVFIGSLALVPFIGSEFFPRTDQGLVSVMIEMPAGFNLKQTDEVASEIERELARHKEVKTIYSTVGTKGGIFGGNTGVNIAAIVIQLVDKDQRNVSDRQFANRLRPRLAGIPSAKITVQVASTMGGGDEADVQIEVTGDDMERLNRIANGVMNIARNTPGTVDVDSDWKIGKPEVQVIPKPDLCDEYGIPVFQVAQILRTSLEGQVASKYRVGDDEYDIRVRLKDAHKENIDQVKDIYIPIESSSVPITQVAEVKLAKGPTQISRKNRQRMVTVEANISKGTLGEVVKAIGRKTSQLSLPPGYRIHFAGMAEFMKESFSNMFVALIMAILLTYMLLAAILESYIQPFTIMLTFPLALVGVLLALFLTGNTLSLFSLMAVIMLVGIVVNNGILLLDYTNVLRARGVGRQEALLQACPTRLRPIIMTNVAIALGMLPLALGKEMRAPMAIVSIGGLLVSALFTLFLIPVMYAAIDQIRERMFKQP